MNMTIQTLRAFKTAAETGSFTRAAEKLYMTQPAFSRMIASLEEEMGVKLFARTTRRISLTAEGEVCLRRVTQILDTYELLLLDMERARHSCSSNLNVGYNPVSGPPEFFLRALRQLGEEYPNIQVSLVRGYSNELSQMLEDGRIECAFVAKDYLMSRASLEILPLQPIYLYALLSVNSRLADLEVVSIRDLVGTPMVFMKNTAPRTRLTVLREYDRQGIPATEDMMVSDLEEMIMRVRISDVVGISSFCDPNHQYPDIVAKRIREFSTTDIERSRVLAWRKDVRTQGLEALKRILMREADGKSINRVFPFD